MPFRILCLHGMGVDAAIFSAQTAPLRHLLPSDYDLLFVDGQAPCDAAPGVAALYPPPYRCWYNTPTTAKVAAAHELIFSVIQKEGPFDAVMGFSQGAAVAASMILRHQIEQPSEPPLFRVAIFICSPVPFSHSLDYGIDTRTYFGMKTSQPSRAGCPTKVPGHLITDAAYLKGEEEVSGHNDGAQQGSYAPQEVYYQMYHPSVDHVRIAIQTAHIYGRRDKWRLHSMDLVKLCRADLATVFEHDGGHEIPKLVSEEICDVIETAVARA